MLIIWLLETAGCKNATFFFFYLWTSLSGGEPQKKKKKFIGSNKDIELFKSINVSQYKLGTSSSVSYYFHARVIMTRAFAYFCFFFFCCCCVNSIDSSFVCLITTKLNFWALKLPCHYYYVNKINNDKAKNCQF